MSSFFVSLWESVFQPGTNPALITATHGSFVMLTLSLIWMVATTKSIHFFNLLIIALCLWASVTWFLHELEKEKDKLKSNEQLAAEGEGEHITESEKESKAKKTK